MPDAPPSPLAEWAEEGPGSDYAVGSLVAPLLEEIESLRSAMARMGLTIESPADPQGPGSLRALSRRLDSLETWLGGWRGDLDDRGARRERRKAVEPLLVGVDALIRAREHLAEKGESPEVASGVGEVVGLFDQLLSAGGFEPVDPAAGERFDPERHVAIARVSGPAGEVVSVAARGWLFEGRVVRPAQVAVGGASPDSA